MLKNYLLIAIRTLRRNTLYSFINIAGLSVGIASSILILLWVADEVSFDKFHANYNHVHQVYQKQNINGVIEVSQNGPYPLLDAVVQRSSLISHSAYISHGEGYLLTVGETRINKMGYVVSEDFPMVFPFKVIEGNFMKALADPKSIVLTKSVAEALFGKESPLNKVVKMENEYEFKVGCVLEDVPDQSTIRFDFLLPFDFYLSTQAWVRRSINDWTNGGFNVYVALQPGASVAEVNSAIKDLIKENNERSPTAEVFLHPMSQWRLYSEFENGKNVGGLIDYVRMLTLVGVFILVIACINFMNLATARSESRAREVGIRKSVGSRRQQLIAQFLGESILITCVAFAVALTMVEVCLPFYNLMVSKSLSIAYGDPMLWLIAGSIILLTGVLAGSYPAFYLSSFQPVKVLKGKVQAGKASGTPRKVLVTFQFGFSIFLIIGTLVIYQQIMHVKTRHTGYNRSDLMLIWTNADIEKNFNTISEELRQSGIVKAVCKSSAPITRIFTNVDDVSWRGKQGDEKVAFVTVATEYDFTKTHEIKLLEGRDFSRDFASDTAAVVVNKAALDIMGLKNPLGEKITMWDSQRTIIGVMDNVIMGSPVQAVDPMVLVLIPGWCSTISVRLEPTSDVAASVAGVESIFKKSDPEHPLWYRFADWEFEQKFTNMNLMSRLAWIATILAVVISSMGLFGLAAFTAEQRTKELGIRKVMGATVTSLVLLISRDFSKLMIVAFAISAPIAWLAWNSFLERYPYRINIPWWVLPATGIGALVLALVIVGVQAMRAARTNPVHSLKSE